MPWTLDKKWAQDKHLWIEPLIGLFAVVNSPVLFVDCHCCYSYFSLRSVWCLWWWSLPAQVQTRSVQTSCKMLKYQNWTILDLVCIKAVENCWVRAWRGDQGPRKQRRLDKYCSRVSDNGQNLSREWNNVKTTATSFMLGRRKGNQDIWGHYFFLLRTLELLAFEVNHKHQNIARKGKGENVIGSFYCGQHLGLFCGWHNINPSGRIQCQFKFLTGLEVPIKTITLVCGWIFSPLIHNLHSWSWGSKFQVVRVSGFGSLSSLHLAWAGSLEAGAES